MTGDPVSWRVIEQGWRVVDADGNEIGRVDQITGDLNGDIFDGITVGDGGTVLTRARYVPAENVAAITEGEIVLDLYAADAARLEPYSEPVSEPLESLAPRDETGASGRGSGSNRGLGRLFGWLSGRR